MPERRPALIVITRPRDQAAGLVDCLCAAGAEVVEFPVIDIEPLPVAHPVPSAQLVLFVSRNAVRHGLPVVAETLRSARAGAVGPGTAAALVEAGIDDPLRPPPDAAAGGEGLLRNPALAAERIDGMRILIVRGAGGREELATGLRERGAIVFELAVYRRTPPTADRGRLQRLRDSHRRPVMVMTSSEGVRNLFRLAGPELHDWLRGLRYAALAPRVAVALREHGVRTPPVLANDTGDSALADAALAADAAHPLPELEAH